MSSVPYYYQTIEMEVLMLITGFLSLKKEPFSIFPNL